ncbi:sulfurtransferase [Nocardia sp. NPDC058499]|uniref:sulfurtransferase n=1 Tax=Nocardia sp. NPDC058499 TaxID=3346530 RepID=UPI00364FAF50
MTEKSPLVSCEWLDEHRDDPRLVVVEVGMPDGYESTRARYRSGHLPNAVWLDWAHDMRNPGGIDVIDQPAFEQLMSAKGIAEDDCVVLYSGDNNIWSTSVYWHMRLYQHATVKVLDGGRPKWEQLGLPLETDTPTRAITDYRSPGLDRSLRAVRSDVLASLGSSVFVDAREPEEYHGKTFSPDQAPNPMGGQRAGHIPGAVNIPWRIAANPDQTFKNAAELRRLFAAAGVPETADTITYCWVGARSAYSWFVLREVLGYPGVRNYDGSWAEYGSSVGAPIEV